MSIDETDRIERFRTICLSFPEVIERLSHGSPSWFIQGRKTLASLDDHHHGVDHLAFWCPALPGVQEEMIADEPQRFFRPPYVGPSGWLGVRLDLPDVDWDEVRAILAEAYRKVGPKKLVAQLDADE